MAFRSLKSGALNICGLRVITMARWGKGGEMVEIYISGQKGYHEKNDTVPVVMID